MKTIFFFQRHACGIVLGSFLLLVTGVNGQFHTPIQIAPPPDSPIVDELGNRPGGRHIDSDQRPLVHLLLIYEGMSIQAPQADGTPGPVHPILYEASVGYGAITECPIESAGRFNINLNANAFHGTQAFVRVYSGTTIATSAYYADSQVVQLSGSAPETVVEFGPVNKLLKQPPHDTWRGDGLTDAVREQLFGSANVDVFADLGDGRTIWDNFVAGTDWTNPDTFLAITSIRPVNEMIGGQPTVVGEILEWASQTGRIYTLQYSTNLILGEFENISNAIGIAATPPMNVFTNLDVPAGAPLYYRVGVDWPDMPEEAEDLIRP